MQAHDLGRAPLGRVLRRPRVEHVPEHAVAIGRCGDRLCRAREECGLSEHADRLLEVVARERRRVVGETALGKRPEDDHRRAVGHDLRRVGRVETHADLQLGRLAARRRHHRRVDRRLARAGRAAVPHGDHLRPARLALRRRLRERHQVLAVRRHVHGVYAVWVRRRDRLDRLRAVRVPDDEHRVGAAVGRRNKPPVRARARTRDRVAVPLQQLLALRVQVVDDARVRGGVEDCGAVSVAQVDHRGTIREAEDPAQAQRGAALRRRHDAAESEPQRLFAGVK